MRSVKVNRKAADRIASGHPWIFASDIVERAGVEAGEAVQVVDYRNRPLGTAHFSSSSQITLRLLSTETEEIDPPFLMRRLTAAIEHRSRVVKDSDAYRVVYSEGDRLPALIVDRYGDYLSMQTLNQGMDRAQPAIVACLEELLAPKGIIARNDVAVRAREELLIETRVVAGEVPARVDITMNGLRWHADLVGGQKTGSISTSGKTIWPRLHTPGEMRWIASPPLAALRCTSRDPASTSKASTAQSMRSSQPNRIAT